MPKNHPENNMQKQNSGAAGDFSISDFDPYAPFISSALIDSLKDGIRPVEGVKGLFSYGPLRHGEKPEALNFAVRLYDQVRPQLWELLARRQRDREFLDRRMEVCSRFNDEHAIAFGSSDYLTPIGLTDGEGRVVFGPLQEDFSRAHGAPVADFPAHLGGPQVTLFGPPDSPAMAINAMNCYHRKLDGEPEIVEKLLSMRDYRPRWGADVEDSKTPLREDMASAADNLSACLRGDLEYHDEAKGRDYRIDPDHSALPIKRFPGLGMPCGFLFRGGVNFPMHIYDFAMHVYNNRDVKDGLIFYVPKLENEEEAAYIHDMVAAAEALIIEEDSSYVAGSIRLMIVLENPRAILRSNEIMDALHPYFLGGSLGWHDYLASAARLFKNEPHYRIPVKADPDIVIKHIKASHDLVARVVGDRGGLALGGMYGILPLESRLGSDTFTVTLAGFFRDVITQLKRGLGGYWVAHPDFVRIGIALVIAWEERVAGRPQEFIELATSLLGSEAQRILDFADGDDIHGLDPEDPMYIRELIVASLEESDFIANNHPDEIRYNVFQTLQYLADWLSGNGCVALPAVLGDQPVRIMDDLATTERSRWEVWHELAHGRFSVEDFMKIALEELDFIRHDHSTDTKVVRIKWDGRTGEWYPVAFHLMLLLMTRKDAPEFATELLLPFTLDGYRDGQAALDRLSALDREKYALPQTVDRYLSYFHICGSHSFAAQASTRPVFDPVWVRTTIEGFDEASLREAASHHGDIGASRAALDSLAAAEQAGLAGEGRELIAKLSSLAAAYQEQFGFKFLISAAGKDAATMLAALEERMNNSRVQELAKACAAVAEIAVKRAGMADALPSFLTGFDPVATLAQDSIDAGQFPAVSIAVSRSSGLPAGENHQADKIQSLALGTSADTLFDIASLSKTVGTAFAMEQLALRGFGPDTAVAALLAELGSPLVLEPVADKGGENGWAGELLVRHLMSHCALNMHYVFGIDHDARPANISQLLMNPGEYGYEPAAILNRPGSRFNYSGAGFMVLEHICELMLGESYRDELTAFVAGCMAEDVDPNEFSFDRSVGLESMPDIRRISGFRDDGSQVSEKPLWFPAFAAGAVATPRAMLAFLSCLTEALNNPAGCGPISHDTAVLMLKTRDRKRSVESREFMGLDMGLGVFTAPMGPNLVAVHQGANDGYRSIFFFAVEGPDAGTGFAIFCNGDNAAVPAVAGLSREIIAALGISGFNPAAVAAGFSSGGIAQEQIVNRGYKELLFSGIQPPVTDTVPNYGEPDDELLASSLLAGTVCLACSDDKFAPVSNLVRTTAPLFDPLLYCSQGKVMDSWETARHNPDGGDWAIFPLNKAATIRAIHASTAYHDGNHVASLALYGMNASDKPSGFVPGPDDAAWLEFLPATPVMGHSVMNLVLNDATPEFTHIKVWAAPDGGLSRLGLYEQVPQAAEPAFTGSVVWNRITTPIPKPSGQANIPLSCIPATPGNAEPAAAGDGKVGEADGLIDLASALNGGEVVFVSNEHYGPASSLVSPIEAIHMFDGLESSRSREAGHSEHARVRLGRPGVISRIELDFSYFVNNNPVAVEITAIQTEGDGQKRSLIVPRTGTKAFAGNTRVIEVEDDATYDAVEIRIFPDGGLNRLRIFGK